MAAHMISQICIALRDLWLPIAALNGRVYTDDSAVDRQRHTAATVPALHIEFGGEDATPFSSEMPPDFDCDLSINAELILLRSDSVAFTEILAQLQELLNADYEAVTLGGLVELAAYAGSEKLDKERTGDGDFLEFRTRWKVRYMTAGANPRAPI